MRWGETAFSSLGSWPTWLCTTQSPCEHVAAQPQRQLQLNVAYDIESCQRAAVPEAQMHITAAPGMSTPCTLTLHVLAGGMRVRRESTGGLHTSGTVREKLGQFSSVAKTGSTLSWITTGMQPCRMASSALGLQPSPAQPQPQEMREAACNHVCRSQGRLPCRLEAASCIYSCTTHLWLHMMQDWVRLAVG